MVIPSGIIPFINYIIIAFLIFHIVVGFKKGFLVQVFHLLGVLVAILVSWYFSPILAEKYEVFPKDYVPFSGTSFADMFYGKMNSLLWYAILFIGALIIFALLKPFMKALMEMPVLHSLNQILGAVFSLLPAGLVLVMAAYFMATPLVLNGNEVLQSTALGPIHTFTQNTFTLVKEPELTEEAIQKIISGQKLNQDELKRLWNWMLQEDADPEEIRNFLNEYSGGEVLPNDLNGTENP